MYCQRLSPGMVSGHKKTERAGGCNRQKRGQMKNECTLKTAARIIHLETGDPVATIERRIAAALAAGNPDAREIIRLTETGGKPQKECSEMKAAMIMVTGYDGHEWQYCLCAEEVAGRVVQGIAESPAGKAGSVARVACLLDVVTIEPVTADGYATDDSTHRLAWRAMRRARKDGSHAYAIHGERHVRLAVHRGALGGRTCYSGPRYTIEGREYVLCADRHYEPSEVRTQGGKLLGCYESVCAA